MRKIFLLTIVSFIFPLLIYSQYSKPVADFSSVDSFSKTIKYNNNVYELTTGLTKQYQAPLLKARVIFKWITENIDYDYKLFNKYYYQNKDYYTYTCREDEDCEEKRIAWETKYINKVLSRKKAVCMGYAMLFKKMCDIAGLKSEMITGYVRTEYYQVGTAGTLNHAWNTIWLNGSCHLLDATWAAGGCSKDSDGKLLDYHKKFNEYYWLTPPGDFVRNHYPENNEWVLLSNYTKDSFSANPYYSYHVLNDLKL